MRSLYEMCAGHVLLPGSLQIELPDISTGVPLCRSGFGDVRKREYQGQEVAVKVLRRYADGGLQKVYLRESPAELPIYFHVLIVAHLEVLQGAHSMERTPSSERVAPARSDNVLDTVRDGVGMDVEWQREGPSEYKSIRACRFFRVFS